MIPIRARRFARNPGNCLLLERGTDDAFAGITGLSLSAAGCLFETHSANEVRRGKCVVNTRKVPGPKGRSMTFARAFAIHTLEVRRFSVGCDK